MGSLSSNPITRKTSESGECVLLKYGAALMQGWRKQMEDTHIADPNFDEETSLFAVFDGHGGQEVALFCKKYLPEQLKLDSNYSKGDYKTALEETFLKLDKMLMSPEGKELLGEFTTAKNTMGLISGCTANVVLIVKDCVYVANSGDSRAVLFTKDHKAHPLSIDHKPELKTEEQRIIKAGGHVYKGRVNRNLNLTRAVGDLYYKQNKNFSLKEQVITAFPDVFTHKISENDAFILMGCDGVWECGSNEDICELVNTRLNDDPTVKLSMVVEEILDKLLATDCSEELGVDNMTAILIMLKEH